MSIFTAIWYVRKVNNFLILLVQLKVAGICRKFSRVNFLSFIQGLGRGHKNEEMNKNKKKKKSVLFSVTLRNLISSFG